MSMTPERARELLALAPKDEFRVVTHRKMSGELTLIECGVFDYAAPPRCAELFAASVDALRAYLAAVERAEAAERERDALRALVRRYADAHAARGEEGVAMTQPRTTLLVASPECIALGEASDEPQHPTKKELDALTQAYAIYKVSQKAGASASVAQQKKLYDRYMKALDKVLAKLKAQTLSAENQAALDAKADAWLKTRAVQGAGKWW